MAYLHVPAPSKSDSSTMPFSLHAASLSFDLLRACPLFSVTNPLTLSIAALPPSSSLMIASSQSF
eukprot:7059728-Prorocentrum_lima.AAC.1